MSISAMRWRSRVSVYGHGHRPLVHGRQQLTDLPQAQAHMLGALEPQPASRTLVVLAVAGGGTGGRGQQAQAFVIPHRVGGEPRLLGEMRDGERHEATVRLGGRSKVKSPPYAS
jgi:hypothetical protein